MLHESLMGWLMLLAPAFPAALFVVLGGWMLVGPELDDRQEKRIAKLTEVAMSLSALAALGAAGLFLHADTPLVVVPAGHWFGSEEYSFDVTLQGDRLSLTMTVLSALITGAIGRFSFRYLHRESGFTRFFMLLSLFATGMLLLVESGSADLLAAGWEMVGLSSALLIGFFHDRATPVSASFRAYLTYRACDVGLLVGAVLLHQYAHSTDFAVVFGAHGWPAPTVHFSRHAATLTALCFVLASMGKSALFPLSNWLPRAMEGPTPSSALFYGALSVHGGVFLLLRMSPLFARSPEASAVLVVLGLLTATYGNFVGRTQSDVKSSLAFASMTQVGLMVAEVGFGWYTLALLHLVGHASLRGLQLLRAPSALADALQMRHANQGQALVPFATGTRFLSPRGMRRMYWSAHKRFHLETALERLLVEPFLSMARALDRLDRRSAALLGVSPPHTLDTEQPEDASEVIDAVRPEVLR